MSEAEDKLIDNPVSANRATDQLERRIIRVAVNEMMEVEVTQVRSPNAASQLYPVSDLPLISMRNPYRGNVVHIWLLHHRRHGLFNGPNFKFIVGMLIPDLLKVKVWPMKMLLEECQAAGMSHARRRNFEIRVAWDNEAGA